MNLRSIYLQVLLCSGVVLLLSLQSCSNSSVVKALPPNGTISDDRELTARKAVVSFGRSQIGDSYKYAGNGPHTWDCSGLTSKAYESIGITLPRSSGQMSRLSGEINLADALPGDLIFFARDGRVIHVSIVTEYRNGSLWVVHSTSSRGVIEEDVLASRYWKEKIFKVLSLKALSERL
ncbi:MAG: NlpC/P60 family protein [Bacteroidota bacterium]